jgi:hypothetical protein
MTASGKEPSERSQFSGSRLGCLPYLDDSGVAFDAFLTGSPHLEISNAEAELDQDLVFRSR